MAGVIAFIIELSISWPILFKNYSLKYFLEYSGGQSVYFGSWQQWGRATEVG